MLFVQVCRNDAISQDDNPKSIVNDIFCSLRVNFLEKNTRFSNLRIKI